MWPTRCVFCGGAQARPVCTPCRVDLPWLEPVFALEPFEAAVAPLAYAFPVDAAIKQFKFQRRLFYAPAFAALMRPALDGLPDGIDALLTEAILLGESEVVQGAAGEIGSRAWV